jgi:NADPH-dependent 7-cyano-7-deazaguanine reductase QueF-like protein
MRSDADSKFCVGHSEIEIDNQSNIVIANKNYKETYLNS